MNQTRDSEGRGSMQDAVRVLLIACGLLSAAVFLAACIFTLVGLGKGGQPVFDSSTNQLSPGWVDGEGNAVTLPAKLSYPSSGVYTLRTIVGEQQGKTGDMSVMFAAKYLNVTILLDGEKIGSCVGRPEGGGKLLGKTFLIAPLPGDAMGKELTIVAEPLLGPNMQYEINAPIIGSGEGLISRIIASDLLMLVILEAIICFGLLLMLFSWQARKTGNGTFLQTGLFAILFALYSLSITDTIHLFVENSQFIYLAEFLLLALAPLPLMVLVYQVCLPKFRPVLLVAIGALTLNLCLQAGLYFFTQLELRDTVQITHIVLGLSVILLIPVLALSGRQGGERFRLLVSFSPVLLGATWDLGRFYLPGTYQKAVGFQFGVLLFIFLQTVYLVRSYLESDLYRKMAYTDALTGLKNRTAFEEKIVELGKTAPLYSSVWCVCADVNNLKGVNDTLGHSAGDALICGAAKALRGVKSKESKLYRTGGDEFVLFAFNQSAESMAQGRARFEEALERYNQNHDLPISVALGYAELARGDTIMSLISRADAVMYADKNRQKEALCKSLPPT